MSDFKNWKNKERGQNIAEKFGLKFDPEALSERGFGEGEPADDEWSKKQEVELSEEETTEEEIEESAEMEETEEEIEERRGRGRKGPHTRGVPDPRLREADEEESQSTDHDALKELIRKHVKSVLEELKNES